MSDFINVKLKVSYMHTITTLRVVIVYVPPFSDFCEISGIFQRILCCSPFLSGLTEDIEGNQTYVPYLKCKVKNVLERQTRAVPCSRR